MKSTMTGKDNCPACGHEIDMSTSIGGEAVPKPGDISLCAYCGNINMFSDDMALIELPKVIFETFDEEDQEAILKARELIRKNPLISKK